MVNLAEVEPSGRRRLAKALAEGVSSVVVSLGWEREEGGFRCRSLMNSLAFLRRSEERRGAYVAS